MVSLHAFPPSFHPLPSLNLQSFHLLQADCVFPTRTARFGQAITFDGFLNTSEFLLLLSSPSPLLVLKISAALFLYLLAIPEFLSHPLLDLGSRSLASDLRPIEQGCPCPTCLSGMTRAFLNSIAGTPNAATGECLFVSLNLDLPSWCSHPSRADFPSFRFVSLRRVDSKINSAITL